MPSNSDVRMPACTLPSVAAIPAASLKPWQTLTSSIAANSAKRSGIAGADVVKLDAARQLRLQALDRLEHQRRHLEFIEASGKRDLEGRGRGGEGLNLEDVRVHPRP